MAIQVLNLSTDAIDFHPMQSVDITEFNDLNTVTEYFAEVVLGHKNAFPESKEKKEKSASLQKNISVKLYDPSPALCVTLRPIVNTDFCIPANDNNTHWLSREINPPPPKAYCVIGS